MPRNVTLDLMEILAMGEIQVRFSIVETNPEEEVVASWYHRTIFLPGGDTESQIATVIAHINSVYSVTCDDSQLNEVRDVISSLWTTKVVEDYIAHRDEMFRVAQSTI